MAPAVARVAVNRPLREPLDYALPPEYADTTQPGMRVVVPLQRDRTAGVVVALADDSPYPNLRPIVELVDAQPVFDGPMLELTRWMGEYYCCGWGECLACAAPPGARWKRAVRYRLADPPPAPFDVLVAGLAGAPRQAAVLRFLRDQGDASTAMIQSATGGAPVHAVLRRLLDGGCIDPAPARGPMTPRARTVLVVEAARDMEELQARAAELSSAAPRQAAVLRALTEAGGRRSATELLAATSAAHSTLRALERRALIRLVSVERSRGPAAADAVFRGAQGVTLTGEQEAALAAIDPPLAGGRFAAFLLEGVTGSGKTEVYLRAAERALGLGRGVIVLVPEISLTAQTVARFQARFGDRVAVLHSKLSVGERADQWRALHAGELRIAIGPRSAVFAPVSRLGLIVVDEEHDGAYKQQDAPRYHARDVAVMRASLGQAVVVLGSATPSLESVANVTAGKYAGLRLTQRPGGTPLPPVDVVDLRRTLRGPRDRTCSDTLLDALGATLDRREQAILFLNRRGFAPSLFCPRCGLSEGCTQCSVSMIWHRGPNVVRCHYCNAERRPPRICSTCGAEGLVPLGAGTEKVDGEIRTYFPAARVVRMDADTTTRKGAHARMLAQVARGEVDVLVGTQMIAKGLDFPNVTLVGVVNVDTGLTLPDFRAAERTAQVLMQVAGRSGRGPRGGRVIFQTFRPDHYAVRAAAIHDFRAFAERELTLRRELGYPPWRHLGRVLCEGSSLAAVSREAKRLGGVLAGTGVEVLGPAPAPLARVQNRFRWHCQILSARSAELRRALDTVREAVGTATTGVRTTLDMDAHHLL